MAYKKYIKRGGKLYGPYIYESHRVGDKIISEYHGADNSSSRKFLWMGIGLFILVVLFASVFYFGGKITGKVVGSDEMSGEISQTKTRIIYPIVYFTLISKQNIETPEESVEETSAEQSTEIPEENFSETSNETTSTTNKSESNTEILIETPSEVPEPSNETPAEEPPAPEQAPITGGVISKIFSGVANFFLSLTPTGKAVSEGIIETQINGEADANNQFVYDLKEGEIVELLPGSVRTSSIVLPDNAIKLSVEGNKVVITTDYSETEEITPVEKPDEQPAEEENESVSNITTVTLEIEEKRVLSDAEKEILRNEFANASIETFKSELFHGRYVIGYRLGDYEIEYSYDANLDNETLDLQMENDRTKWLKDIIKTFSQNETPHEEATQFVQDYPVEG